MILRWIVSVLAMSLAGSGCQPADNRVGFKEIERRTLTLEVDVSGTLEAVQADRAGPPSIPGIWNYKIAMMAPEGEEVKQGGPVLVFDASPLAQLLDEKIAERDSAATQLRLETSAAKVARRDEQLALAEAEAALDKAKLEADVPKDITAVIELEKAKLDLQLAHEKIRHLQRKAEAARRRDAATIARWRSKHDRAAQRVTEIQSAIEEMTVQAPRTGTVIHQTNWQGEKKKVGDSAWRSETVLRVVSLEHMKAVGEVSEVDSSKLAVGQRVSLRLDAQADVQISGTIEKLSHAVRRASPENPLKVVEVDITLDQDNGPRLRPGMRFRGRIEIDRLEDVLTVPVDALQPTPDGPMVQRRTESSPAPVLVQLGRRNERHAVVLEGLSEGDEVLVEEDVP